MRSLNFLLVALILSTAIALYNVKYQVQDLEATVRDLNRQYRAEEDAIQILSAEWSYRNKPRELERLAAQYLDLRPLRPAQIVDIQTIPFRPPPGDGPPIEYAMTREGLVVVLPRNRPPVPELPEPPVPPEGDPRP